MTTTTSSSSMASSRHELEKLHQEEKKADDDAVEDDDDDDDDRLFEPLLPASSSSDSHQNNSSTLARDVASNASTALYISSISSDLRDMKQDIRATRQQFQVLQEQIQDLKQTVVETSRRNDGDSLWAALTNAWNWFFHSRVDESGILLASRMRIAYAVLAVADKILLSFDLTEFLSPTQGVLPLWAERADMDHKGRYTILQAYPESDAWMWAWHWIGLAQAVLLLLGIAPRFNAAGVLFSYATFQHHNHLIYDGQDVMFRVWCLHMMSMPIHRLTLPGWIRHRRSTTPEQRQRLDRQRGAETYPIWPFRLLQIQICLVYLGAGGVKLTGTQWTTGTALFYMVHNDDFYGKLFNPDIIFNYMISIKFFTYKALLVECSVPFLIWHPKTKYVMLYLIIFLHLGMELSLNMHCFEWLTIWAWCSFFAEPIANNKNNSTNNNSSKKKLS